MADTTDDAAYIEEAKPPKPETVTLPLGTEFEVETHHKSIAEKLGAKLEDVVFAIETDVKAGVHKLKGWLRIA